MADPKYVRLRGELQGRCIADIAGGSGWSISGLDVKEVPAGGPARAFVRAQLAAGTLVEASDQSFQNVQDVHAESPTGAGPDPEAPPVHIQEGQVQAHAEQRRQELIDAESEEEEGDEEADEEEGDEYDDLSLEDLRTEAGNRGLSKSGTKSELITRLREDDEED